jgi:hypothetical protein
MRLNNLVGISLEKIPSSSVTINRLISAAERNITDAMRKQRNVPIIQVILCLKVR